MGKCECLQYLDCRQHLGQYLVVHISIDYSVYPMERRYWHHRVGESEIESIRRW